MCPSISPSWNGPSSRLRRCEASGDGVSAAGFGAELAFVHKPAGMPVHRTGRIFFHTLANLVKEKLGDGAWAPLNRLDRETSGIVAFARGPEAFKALAPDGAGVRWTKVYAAVVRGVLPEAGIGRIDQPLGESAGDRDPLPHARPRRRQTLRHPVPHRDGTERLFPGGPLPHHGTEAPTAGPSRLGRMPGGRGQDVFRGRRRLPGAPGAGAGRRGLPCSGGPAPAIACLLAESCARRRRFRRWRRRQRVRRGL